MLTRELIDDRALPLRIGCCSLTVLNRKDNPGSVRGTYTPVALGSGDHLSQGASRDWGFEDIQVGDSGEVRYTWTAARYNKLNHALLHTQVIEDLGVPGTETDEDLPVGPQLHKSDAAEQVARM